MAEFHCLFDGMHLRQVQGQDTLYCPLCKMTYSGPFLNQMKFVKDTRHTATESEEENELGP